MNKRHPFHSMLQRSTSFSPPQTLPPKSLDELLSRQQPMEGSSQHEWKLDAQAWPPIKEDDLGVSEAGIPELKTNLNKLDQMKNNLMGIICKLY